MNKIKLILFLLGMVSFSAYAQNRSPQSATAEKPQSAQMQSNIITVFKDCPELHTQLINLFGQDYNVSDVRVVKQLEKNIADKNASMCVRKSSLYGIYGEDYKNHINLIDLNPNSKTK